MSAPTEQKRLKKEEHENEVPIYIVDAFTSKAFEGNPAAVCLVSPEHVSTDMYFFYSGIWGGACVLVFGGLLVFREW